MVIVVMILIYYLASLPDESPSQISANDSKTNQPREIPGTLYGVTFFYWRTSGYDIIEVVAVIQKQG
jgi:hypothetical protein